jgi:hypothetical protein
MNIQISDIAKSAEDAAGGYDLLVDLNQVGLKEDESPPQVVHVDGVKFDLCGRVMSPEGPHGQPEKLLFYSYWNESPVEAACVNLQLWTVERPCSTG